MKDKSTFIGIIVMALACTAFILWLGMIFSHNSDFTKDGLWFLFPFSYGAWMFLDDDEDVIKQHLKLFNAAISVFKKKK